MEKCVSIIIVSYHTGAVLSRTLDHVFMQEGLNEIILVDNGNPDDVVARLQNISQENDRLKIVTGHGNVGFAKGCNIGVKQASSEYVLILNPDCLLPKNALIDAVSEMRAHPEAWLGGSQMICLDGTIQGGSKRSLLTPKIALFQITRLYKFGFASMNLPEKVEEMESSFVPAISGAFMLMKRDRYNELGGIDERFFFHVEDLDLCMKVNKKGAKVLFIPKVKTLHYRGSSAVSSFFVERNKAEGFRLYFDKYRKDIKPAFLYYFIIAGIYLRMMAKFIPLVVRIPFEKKRIKSRSLRSQRQINFLNENISDDYLVNDDLKNAQPVLLAGTTGQVGLAILRQLLKNDIKVNAFYHREIVDYRHENLNWVQGDLAQEELNFGNVTGKTLIHTPAIWLLPKHLEQLNKLGIKRVICFSSSSIEGKSSSKNMYEKELIEKFINAEKCLAKKCAELNMEYTIMRPTMIYGAGLDRNVSSIVRFINIFGFFPVAKPANGMRKPVHIDDLAAAVLKSINNKNSFAKTYNLTGNEELRYDDMVVRIFEAIGKKKRILKIAQLPIFLDIFSFITRRKDINGEIAKRMNENLVFSSQQAQEDIGYSPRKFLSAGAKDLGL